MTPRPVSEDAALEYLIDAAYIFGTMDSDSVFDHYDATDYLKWAADLYSEVTE
jgi:hypothetical protein